MVYPMRRNKCFAGPFLALALALPASGCGMGTGSDPAQGPSTPALLTSGLPQCSPLLLHPKLTVGATAEHPGKLIVYVDGVMACIDDAARVDQLIGQVESRAAVPAKE